LYSNQLVGADNVAAGGWREFRYNGVRFDILQGQFLRLRHRKEDRGSLRAYLIVDILKRRPLMIELYEDGALVEQVTLGDNRLPDQITR
jgi:hypothetical protein